MTKETLLKLSTSHKVYGVITQVPQTILHNQDNESQPKKKGKQRS